MQSKRRKKAGKIFRLALVITVFVLIIATVVLSAAALIFFRVEKYHVEGVSPYTRDQIIEASGIQTGKSLIFADLDEAAASIEKKLPYTGSVKLSRKFPNTLVIKYDEYKETYAVPVSMAGYVLLGNDFKVLSYSAELPEGVTLINGASPTAPVVGEKIKFTDAAQETGDTTEIADPTGDILARIASALEDNSFEDISAIDVTSRSNIYLIYQRRIVLKLGNPSSLDSKLALAKKVLQEEDSIAPDQSGVVNLTVVKQAYFDGRDADDIPELVEFEAGYPQVPADEPTTDGEETTTDESSGGEG